MQWPAFRLAVWTVAVPGLWTGAGVWGWGMQFCHPNWVQNEAQRQRTRREKTESGFQNMFPGPSISISSANCTIFMSMLLWGLNEMMCIKCLAEVTILIKVRHYFSSNHHHNKTYVLLWLTFSFQSVSWSSLLGFLLFFLKATRVLIYSFKIFASDLLV